MYRHDGPAIGTVFDLKGIAFGVLHSDYWKVVAVTGTRRRSVFLRRCDSAGTRRRIGLNDFNAAWARGDYRVSP